LQISKVFPIKFYGDAILFGFDCLYLVSGRALAQNYDFAENQKWLQQQFNTLARGQTEEAGFLFDDCLATLRLKVASGQGGFLNMDMGTHLAGIQSVSYEKKGAEFLLTILPEKFEQNNNSYQFIFQTKNEKLMQELKQRLEWQIGECKKKKSP
jgi:hypothetical protein